MEALPACEGGADWKPVHETLGDMPRGGIITSSRGRPTRKFTGANGRRRTLHRLGPRKCASWRWRNVPRMRTSRRFWRSCRNCVSGCAGRNWRAGSGAITAMHRLKRVTRGNVALVGDASGGVDAITGEGLRLAFRQSLALAEALKRDDLSGYERAHRELARRPMRMGKLMLLLGRNEGLRQRSFAALASNPLLFEDLLAMHIGQASRVQMVGTGLELGWQFLTT